MHQIWLYPNGYAPNALKSETINLKKKKKNEKRKANVKINIK